jgi:hypothetical protein
MITATNCEFTKDHKTIITWLIVLKIMVENFDENIILSTKERSKSWVEEE